MFGFAYTEVNSATFLTSSLFFRIELDPIKIFALAVEQIQMHMNPSFPCSIPPSFTNISAILPLALCS